jgi:hypothetical protein
MDKYKTFIESKRQRLSDGGFSADWQPEDAFDFQKFAVEKACARGRCAVFFDTGLGKTLIQLAIAHNVVRHTKKRVLILTPLAVAFQFLAEAERIGVPGVSQSKNGKLLSDITVANYERLHLFNASDFECVMLDESSILKNFEGTTRDQIVEFMKKVKYRYLSTATPSPNDFTELGNSSEALGHMGYMDMLSRFFKAHDGALDSNERNVGERFYMKPHAKDDFFAWLNQWAIMAKMPSDLGFSDEGYVLPELEICQHLTESPLLEELTSQQLLFPKQARSLKEIRAAQAKTINERCALAVDLASNKRSVYWVNLNPEGDLIQKLDPSAAQIKGSMSIEKKEELLMAFASGQIERLITKAKMTSMGLNWQHCNHTVFFPTFSYEQYYQAIRRFWRFGQTMPVVCDMVISDGQERVVQALQEKTQKAIELYRNIIEAANQPFHHSVKPFNQLVKKPSFL